MRLDAWRIENGMTPAQAATKIGTDTQSYCRYEKGDPVGTRRLAERFSRNTDGLVSIEELLFPAGVPPLVTFTAEEAKERAQG